jgi:nitrite reductase/ring-hydroxylating ferredoxin subunit
MRGIMEEKAGEDFMTTVWSKSLALLTRPVSIFVFVALCFVFGCNNGPVDDPIPFQAFATITININLPEFQGLRSKGYTYINDGGVKGIILYRENTDRYHAYERTCSYKPLEACATVDIHSSGLYMSDPCCSSTFDFTTGNPTSGPAWRSLNEYSTSVSGNQITISDVLVN